MVSDGAAISPMWAHSGRELFYGTPQGMVAAQIETSPSFRVTGRELLFELPERASVGIAAGWYDVTSDDQRFLMARVPLADQNEADVPQLILVRNFFEELKERVPN